MYSFFGDMQGASSTHRKNRKWHVPLKDFTQASSESIHSRDLSSYWPTKDKETKQRLSEASGLIVKLQDDETTWYFKNSANVHTLSFKLNLQQMQEAFEIEAAVSEIWRFLIGSRAPLNRCVTDASGKVIGLISKAMDFESAADRYEHEPAFFNLAHFAKYDLASISAAAYFLEDIDMNPYNWGIGKSLNTFVKIDHGQSLAGFIATEFKAQLERRARTLSGSFQKQSSGPSKCKKSLDKKKHIILESRPILKNDIIDLPEIDSQHWNAWIEPNYRLIFHKGTDKERGFMTKPKEQAVFRQLSRNPEFVFRKYRMFVKILLIPESLIVTAAKGHLSLRNTMNGFQHYFKQRTESLRSMLLSLSQFRQFIQENDLLLSEFISETEIFFSENPKFAHLEKDIKEHMALKFGKLVDEINQIGMSPKIP